MSSSSFLSCPICNERGIQSKLRFVPHGVLTFLWCDLPNCPYNLESHHIVKQSSSENAVILRSHIMRLGAPITLLKDPNVKRMHLRKLLWAKKMRVNIYGWMATEVNKMICSFSLPVMGHMVTSSEVYGSKYELSDDVKKLLKFTEDDIEICKHLIPDLKRIIRVIKWSYDNTSKLLESFSALQIA